VAVNTIAGIRIGKTADTPVVEPGDPVAYSVEYSNSSTSKIDEMTAIDVLPWNGDARGSDFHGSVTLAGVEVDGEQEIWFTKRAPAEISDNPKDASNDLEDGETEWCPAGQVGKESKCPASLAEVTGVLIHDAGNPVGVGELREFKVTLDTQGSQIGDIYGNRSVLASPTVTFPAFSGAATATVAAAAQIGDFVWLDRDRDGAQDPGEPGIKGVEVNLTGEDKNGTPVDLTTITDEDGRYLFDGLVSGDYRVHFGLPDGFEYTIPGATASVDDDSNADQVTGRSGVFTVGPNQADLSRDGGLVDLPARITIHKRADPAQDVDFGFTVTGGLAPEEFTLNDDGAGNEDERTFAEVPPGKYEFREVSHEGWDLTDLGCEGSGEWMAEGSLLGIEVGPGDELDCYFVNSKLGSVTIIKDAQPDGATPFDFTTTGGLAPGDAFSLTDDGTGADAATFEVPVAGGAYTIGEDALAGWDLTDLECSVDGPATATPDLAGHAVNVEVTGAGGSVTCTFTNRQKPPKQPEEPGDPGNPGDPGDPGNPGQPGDPGGPDQPARPGTEHRHHGKASKRAKAKEPRLVLRKTADRKAAEPGETVRFRIRFRNVVAGTVARKVLICDRVPARMTLVGLGGGKLSDGRVCWAIRRVPFSKSWRSRSVVMRIDADARPGSRVTNVVVSGRAKDQATVRVERPADYGVPPADQAGGVTG
jgi:uncharacterized repeat protein (TIGR01451 family)